MMSIENSNAKVPEPAEFQTAVAATGFGKFNYILILIFIPAGWTIQFESTLASYIIPAAACDLKLDATQRGLLNSMPFFGMLTSGFLCGFIMDTLGRRKFLSIAYSLESIIVFANSLASNFLMLSVFKYLSGCLTGGIYVALTTYALEFHSNENRGKIQMIFGIIYQAANFVIPYLSSIILPLNIDVSLGFMDFHAWNLLLLICSLNSIISTVTFYFLPETPKYLMTIGKNDKAMELFRKMYKMNIGDQKGKYPVEALIEENANEDKSNLEEKPWKEYLYLGWQQIKPLFKKQYGLKLIGVCVVQSLFLMGTNSLRLYLPQIFQATHDYEIIHNKTSTDICSILDILRSASDIDDDNVCTVNLENNFQVYLNSMIICLVIIFAYAMIGILINLFEKKLLLGVMGTSASITGICISLSTNTATMLILSSMYLSATAVCLDIFMTVLVVMFPTSLRAMAISIILFVGRSMTIIGNMLVPFLVGIGCMPPFILLGSIVLVAVIIACIMPNSGKEDMK